MDAYAKIIIASYMEEARSLKSSSRSCAIDFNSETAFTRYKLSASKQVWFMCNSSRKDDSKSYLLGMWMEDKAAARLQECLVLGQDTEGSKFKLANNRRKVLMVVVRDIFVAYISYHKTVIILIWLKLENHWYSQENIKILKEQKNVIYIMYVMKKYLESFLKKYLSAQMCV